MTAPGMPLQQAGYQFRLMAAQDLALVRAWQMAPHVQEWWDDDPITLASEDEPALDQYIVVVEGRPFAYLQCYLQSAYPGRGRCGQRLASLQRSVSLQDDSDAAGPRSRRRR
jgi:hypothetical protein